MAILQMQSNFEHMIPVTMQVSEIGHYHAPPYHIPLGIHHWCYRHLRLYHQYHHNYPLINTTTIIISSSITITTTFTHHHHCHCHVVIIPAN